MGHRYSTQQINDGLRGKQHKNLTLQALVRFIRPDFHPKDEFDHLIRYTLQRLLRWYVLIGIDRKGNGVLTNEPLQDWLDKYIHSDEYDFLEVRRDHLRKVLCREPYDDVRKDLGDSGSIPPSMRGDTLREASKKSDGGQAETTTPVPRTHSLVPLGSKSELGPNTIVPHLLAFVRGGKEEGEKFSYEQVESLYYLLALDGLMLPKHKFLSVLRYKTYPKHKHPKENEHRGSPGESQEVVACPGASRGDHERLDIPRREHALASSYASNDDPTEMSEEGYSVRKTEIWLHMYIHNIQNHRLCDGLHEESKLIRKRDKQMQLAGA